MLDVLDLLDARASTEHKLSHTHLANTLNNSETLRMAVGSSDHIIVPASSCELVPRYLGRW